MPRPRALISIVLLLGAALAIVALEAWHGPVLLSVSADHGIDTGDILAIPLVVVALAVGRGQVAGRAPGGWAAPTSAILLGALMLLADVVSKLGGGPLVPSGGGTFDGTVRQASAIRPLPVDRWSDLAMTYDSARLRLYVNGRQVSSRATTGTIQTPQDPLWIGGNLPYGEHFNGVIDEVRIYERALSEDEIRHDMARPVAPEPGLVAGYGFDARSGRTAVDVSGNDNTGEVSGATWAPGRYGGALRFDGETAVVRVPASSSLNLTRTMTLSGWVRPSAPQEGWRTVVQRQADAYLLTASSDRQNRSGVIDDLRVAVVVAAAAWLCVVIATARSPWTAPRRRSWWLPVALFTVGSLADAALAPSGALIGPVLVALWLAATAPSLFEKATFLVAAALSAGLTIGSLSHVAPLDAALARNDGAIARTVALGALFAIAGISQLAATARSSPLTSQ